MPERCGTDGGTDRRSKTQPNLMKEKGAVLSHKYHWGRRESHVLHADVSVSKRVFQDLPEDIMGLLNLGND